MSYKCFKFSFIIILFIEIFFTFPAEAQVPKGQNLLSDGMNSLTPYGINSPERFIKKVEVKGENFAEAFNINTLNEETLKDDIGLSAGITTALKKGDVLWISFKSRCIKSTRETGEASFELRFDQLVDGKYVWPPFLERGISFGKEWTETSVPFVMIKDVQPEDVKLVIHFDSYPQHFELGPVTFMNCGKNINLNELPRTTINYEGGEKDAPWRKAAADRIEKYRKGDLVIKVIDENQKPVKNAEVSVEMTRVAFNWGTATSSERLLDSKSSDSKIYRDTLLRYFNQVVLENEMKWHNWTDPKNRHEQTFTGLEWLHAHELPVRGHVMVWPSFRHLPKYINELKTDTALLRSAIFNHIEEQTEKMHGQFQEWDVINEPYAHHDLMDILGKYEMVKWFNLAHKKEPNVKLFLNDYTMFHGDSWDDSPGESFYQTVKYLKDMKAPIHAIGEQGHIGGTPPGIPKVIDRLDRFAELGLPIQISEFDINSNDDDFKARYLGDFMTAVFSHPATTGFVQWGFWEGQHWFPVAALWNKDWTIRKHGKVFTDLVSKTWWTNFEGITSDNGTVEFRGFCGDYNITIKYKGQTVQQKYSLSNNGGELIIKTNQ